MSTCAVALYIVWLWCCICAASTCFQRELACASCIIPICESLHVVVCFCRKYLHLARVCVHTRSSSLHCVALVLYVCSEYLLPARACTHLLCHLHSVTQPTCKCSACKVQYVSWGMTCQRAIGCAIPLRASWLLRSSRLALSKQVVHKP